MDIKEITKSIQDNLDYIALEYKKIKRLEQRISENPDTQQKSRLEEQIKESRIYILDLEQENEENNFDLRIAKIEAMKDKLKEQKENNEITEDEYYDKLTTIGQYSRIVQGTKDLKQLEIELAKNSVISTKRSTTLQQKEHFESSSIAKKQEVFAIQKSLDTKIKRFRRRLLYHQENESISAEELETARKEINNQDYSHCNIDNLFIDMESLFGSVQNLSEINKENLLKSYVSQTCPKTEVHEIIEIDDNKIKQQLFEQYGFDISANLQLAAVRLTNHTKLNELPGMQHEVSQEIR